MAEKSSTTSFAPVSVASSCAAISACSHAAVTSPLMEMSAAPGASSATSMVAPVVDTIPPRWWWCLVADRLDDLDEIAQPGDLEDVLVVRGEPRGPDGHLLGSRTREQPDDERDAGGVDV